MAALLVLLCLIFALRLFSLNRNLREGAAQLRIRRQEKSAVPLRLAAPHQASEELLAEINALLQDVEEERAAFRRQERALRQQIANVSHDLRTPLTSILGYLQLLERADITEEERREYLSVIEGRAKVLQSLIASFYDLSRLEAGEYPVVKERVDLREVIGALLAAFYDELESRFAVTVHLPDDLPAVWGDKAAMTRVYSNLIRNALEHGSGTLTISATREGEQVVTRFSNSGAELKKEDIPHVFDRFFTADKTRAGYNSGLGLAIVNALAKQMEGHAEAELTENQFSIILYWKT